MYNFLVGILQSVGDSKHPLIYLIISSIINIVLDLILVAGLGMGVGAAAFATVVFSVYQCALMLASTFKKPRRIQNTSVPYSYGLADAPPDYFQWSASRTAKLHYFTGKCSCSVQY